MVQFLSTLLLLHHLQFSFSLDEFSPSKAILWQTPQTPHKTTFDFAGDQLTVLTGDSVILTKASLHRKNQLFVKDFIVDYSSPARSGWNLGMQASRYEGMHLTNHQGFISHQSYTYEYKMHGALSHDQCGTLCLLEQAHMPASKGQVQELSSLYTSLKDFYWIQVDQHMLENSYSLDFDHTQVFPENRLSNASVRLFHYHEDRYQMIPSHQLHGITEYYSFESNTYYNRQFHKLVASMDMNQHIEVLVPLLTTAHVDTFAKRACICVRNLSLNLKNTIEAKAMSRRVRFRILRSPKYLEVQRVKSVSDGPLTSNVLSILGNPQFFRPSTFSYISPSDLYPLRIEDQRNASQRHKRAIPLAAKLSFLMASKLVQFSLPYAISGHQNFLQKLKSEVQGKFLSAPQVSLSNSSFQSYLNDKFSTGSAKVSMKEDRILVEYDEPNQSLQSKDPPSLSHVHQLNDISFDLSFIEKEILPQISPALLHQLIQSLPFQLNPGSPILLKTSTAGTFQRHRFWLELYRHDLSYTHFQATALPYQIVNGEYTSFNVPNSSVLDITRDQNDPLLQKACLNHLLADTNTRTADVCASEVYLARATQLLFKLAAGNVWVFHGNALLHLECFRHVTTALSLNHQFNVVFISSSCAASLDKKHTTADVLATEAIFHEHPFQILVQIDVPQLTSKYEKMYFWLILLSSASLLTLIGFALAYAFLYYIKLKYKPKLCVNSDGLIDISVKHIPKTLPESTVSSQLFDVEEHIDASFVKEDFSTKVFPKLTEASSNLVDTTTCSPDTADSTSPTGIRKQKPAAH